MWKLSTTWIRVRELYSYWKKKGAQIIKCKTVDKLQEKAKIGDIIQLHDPDKGWHHSIIISRGSKGKFKYAGHNTNHKAADLNKIKKTDDDNFRIIRIK